MSDAETPKDPHPPKRDERATAPGPTTEPPRRGALRTLAVVGGCAYAGALAVPSIPFLLSTGGDDGAAPDEGSWYRVAKLDTLKELVPFRVKIKGDERDAFTVTKDQTIGSVWLVKEGEAVRAMSAECPHLGCAIDATADGKGFSCPCHTSNFALDGAPMEGPSPRPMDELATRVTDGWIEVDFRRFRQGIAEKVEA